MQRAERGSAAGGGCRYFPAHSLYSIQRGHSVDAFLSMSLFVATSLRNRVTSAMSFSSGPNRLMRTCRESISCGESSSTAKLTAPTPNFSDKNFRSHAVNSFALVAVERKMTKAHV